ncbi:MAG: hypothetical protein BWY91_02729 [bacterium ADurb.BinA028]|nr:MAG: hypothetical protein BWY91_02729 [bacterium ADurb.BinA028]
MAFGADEVPPEGKLLRQPEARLPQGHPVDLVGRGVVLGLRDRPLGACLIDHPDAHLVAVVDVRPDEGRRVLAHDDRRGEQLAPGLGGAIGQGSLAGLLGRGIDAKGSQDLGESQRRDRMEVAVEPPEVDADAIGLRQCLQLFQRGGRGRLNGVGGVGHRSCLVGGAGETSGAILPLPRGMPCRPAGSGLPGCDVAGREAAHEVASTCVITPPATTSWALSRPKGDRSDSARRREPAVDRRPSAVDE